MHILISLLIFGVIVMVHEWGHFYVARKNGIFVEEFAIGMGPLLLSKTDKIGTLYSIRLLPIGGYCKMLGEDGEKKSKDDADHLQPLPPEEGSYQSKHVFARMSVILAGSVMNFILSFVLVLVVVSMNGFASLTVETVSPDSPAALVGLQPGDQITHIAGRRLFVFADAPSAIASVGQNPLTMVVNRAGQRLTLTDIVPDIGPGGNYIIGFTSVFYAGLGGHDDRPTPHVFQVITQSFNTTLYYTRLIAYGLFQLVTFNVSMNDMAGPLGIIGMVGDTYQAAATISQRAVATQMINLAALLSANLGLFNLLPIPALDGGRMVFLTIEAIRGKPIDQEKEGMVHLAGFVLLMGLIVVVFFNDIANLFR